MNSTVPELMHARVAALGVAIGLDPLVMDDDDQLDFELGNGLSMQLSSEPEQEAFLLSGVAGALPWPADSGLLIELLQGNFGWRDTQGATISLDGDSPPNVAVAHRLFWATLTDASFLAAFKGMQGLLDDLQAWLVAKAAATPQAAGAPPGPRPGGFA
ncbi:MAG TPA: type III secretion system chaperone [Hydrogenophaga sp.]|uniref:type III secretion system chaperone n=1 Tax=Hydrogenophaga sp. TaxID=1904254 RepID=UPI002BC4ADB6|nr:type III secretion system chaperone [Hydrogenophaga sp.]HSX94930.1 type III secretion system chaperone [Hydrogenophaga sp.]